MLKSCKYCGRVHDKRYDCGKKPVYQYTRKEWEQGRYTGAWIKKSEEIKERSLYLCAVHRDNGEYISEDLETHHIIKLKQRPDLLLEDGNLICLCQHCHRLAEKGAISVDYLMSLARKRDKQSPGG